MGGGSSATPKLYYVIYEQPLRSTPLSYIFSTARCSSVPSCLRYIPSRPSRDGFERSKLTRPDQTKLSNMNKRGYC